MKIPSGRPLPLGQRGVARISYFCDLQQASSLVIPLGVMTEVTSANIRGLGLIARTRLLDEELEHVASMMREKISNPFDLLRGEFDWGWSNAGAGEALRSFAKRHTDSLFFSPPTVRGFTADGTQIEQKMHSLLNKEFASFLEETLRRRAFLKAAPQKGLCVLQDRLAA